MFIILLLLTLYTPTLLASTDTHDIRYDQMTFLAAHNAFASTGHGYVYAQQKWTIKEQLQNGVRCLQLDIHVLNKSWLNSLVQGVNQFATDTKEAFEDAGEEIGSWFGVKKSKNKKKSTPNNHAIYLCHGPCDLTAAFFRPGHLSVQTLQSALSTIKSFLDSNKTEIVTLFLEDRVKNASLVDEAFAPVKHLLLTPADWNPQRQKGWPTISWMQKNNKRLVVFDNAMETKLLWDQTDQVVTNMFSTLDEHKACQLLHKTGHERYLYLFTFFPHFYTPTNANDIDNLMDFFNQTYKNLSFATTNSTRLQSALAFCIHRGLEYCTGKNKACDSAYYYAGRYPNFIALDFVNEGKPMNIINKINTMPHKDEIFKPMPGIATSKKK